MRRIDPKSIVYITTLTLLIIAPLMRPSTLITLSDVVLAIVLAHTIANTLTGTLTIVVKLLKRY